MEALCLKSQGLAHQEIVKLAGISANTLGAFLGFVWCFERVFIKSPSGRKRFNVLGALNAITHEVITVTNETYIIEHWQIWGEHKKGVTHEQVWSARAILAQKVSLCSNAFSGKGVV
jgi:hypothetical protein